MAVRAQAKYVRVTPRKAREVVDLIRGKSVADARSTLFFANRNSARVVARVLNSAVANAENNNALSADDLYVKEARVDEGPTLKRGSSAPWAGSAASASAAGHITIAVEQREVRS
jgi:large subunit ribosomal protein L22